MGREVELDIRKDDRGKGAHAGCPLARAGSGLTVARRPSTTVRYRAGGVAWISGAGSGLGRSLAFALARRGIAVLATDINGVAVEETASRADGEVGRRAHRRHRR